MLVFRVVRDQEDLSQICPVPYVDVLFGRQSHSSLSVFILEYK